MTVDNPLTAGGAAEEAEPDNRLKVCYYCGKRVPADAAKCETCGNDRSFTWTKKI